MMRPLAIPIPACAQRLRSGYARLLLGLLTVGLSMAAAGAAQAQAGGDATRAQASFIDRLYRDGDAYRAESEVLRFLYAHPTDALRPQVELLRAKLHYREARYPETRLMLYSLLDRYPSSPASEDARRLLTFTHLRLGQTRAASETAPALAEPGRPAPTPAELEPLAGPPQGAVNVEAAVAWSTWLPGSGYFLLGEPGKAVTGVTLNLALLGATAYALREDNLPAALLFLAFEAMLWQGGRSGVEQDALALNRRLQARRLDEWMATHGERELLGVGISLRFGGG